MKTVAAPFFVGRRLHQFMIASSDSNIMLPGVSNYPLWKAAPFNYYSLFCLTKSIAQSLQFFFISKTTKS